MLTHGVFLSFFLATCLSLTDNCDYCKITPDSDQIVCDWNHDPNIPLLEKLPVECFPKNVTEIQVRNHMISELTEEDFSGFPNLKVIDLRRNQISKWQETAFRNVSNLRKIDISGNSIETITTGHFRNLANLRELDLSGNQLTELRRHVFIHLPDLETLRLYSNPLKTIHSEAFAGTAIKYLFLQETEISVLPTEDLSFVQTINVKNVRSLKKFPSHEDLPGIQNLYLTYTAHCCQYVGERWVPPVEIITGLPTDVTPHPVATRHPTLTLPPLPDYLDFLPQFLADTPTDFPSGIPSDLPDIPSDLPDSPVVCFPEPDQFNSCGDVVGWWWLRVFIWIIIITNLLGNLSVIFTFIVAYHHFTAVRLLIINMAFADLCVGIYLLTIAIVDAVTYDVYANYAVAWKTGGGCSFAGFITVFGSELSLFMLASITVERLYRLQNALYFKKLRMKQAIAITVFGWTVAAVLAALPLAGISDYTVSAICLPFELSGGGTAYITFILLINAIAFIIILSVYVYLFMSITGGKFQRQNHDIAVLKKMSILIAVDFFCWAPIIVMGLLVTYENEEDKPSISLSAAKVIMVLIYPLNACCNPFLYVILTQQFKRDFFEFCYKKLGIFQGHYRRALDAVAPASPRPTIRVNRRGTDCLTLPMNGTPRPSISTSPTLPTRRNGHVPEDGRKVSANSNTEVTVISNGQTVGMESVSDGRQTLEVLPEAHPEVSDIDISWMSESVTV